VAPPRVSSMASEAPLVHFAVKATRNPAKTEEAQKVFNNFS
jgi:hypothetical protein